MINDMNTNIPDKLHKITTGFVIQVFDGKSGKCTSQEFVAASEVQYETPEGGLIPDELEFEFIDKEQYFPFEMVQPEN